MGRRTVICRHHAMEVVQIQLNKGEKIPLHDHTDMTIFCQINYGKCRLKSYDFVGFKDGKKVLRLVQDRIVQTGDHCSITPSHCNFHEFEALENTQFTDVFTPPYEVDDTTMHWYRLEKIAGTTHDYIAHVISEEEITLPFAVEYEHEEAFAMAG